MKRGNFLAIILSIFIVLIFIAMVQSAANKSRGWASENEVSVSVSGFNGTLQQAIGNGLLKGSSNSVNNILPVLDPGHDFDDVWVSVNGNEQTLRQALASSGGLCGISNPKISYLNKSIKGHYATEVEINVNGEIKSLQDAINDGSISEVGECDPRIKLNIVSNVLNYNIFSEVGSPIEPVNITLTIESGVRVGSASNSTPALTTGNLPLGSEVIIINKGRIQGAGGNGAPSNTFGTVGIPGGNAIEITVKTIINNTYGQIWSGGGGGGGGVSYFLGGEWYNACGGGGGGGGAGVNPGKGVMYHPGQPQWNYLMSPGQDGTTESGGAASGDDRAGCVNQRGGDGGNPGMPGNPSENNFAGGAAGLSVKTNSNSLTWISQGDLRGPVQ